MTTHTNPTADHDEASAHNDKLNEPLEVLWWGYARGRVYEYNHGRDDSAVQDTLERHDRKVVITTPHEARAVAFELESYIGEVECRVWLTSAMEKSIRRVHAAIIDGMAERGFEHVTGSFGRTNGFEPEHESCDYCGHVYESDEDEISHQFEKMFNNCGLDR